MMFFQIIIDNPLTKFHTYTALFRSPSKSFRRLYTPHQEKLDVFSCSIQVFHYDHHDGSQVPPPRSLKVHKKRHVSYAHQVSWLLGRIRRKHSTGLLLHVIFRNKKITLSEAD